MADINALNIARETTFDTGTYTNVWMDNNYDWTNPNFVQCTRYLINYDTNILADTIYTLISSVSVKGDVDGNGQITATDALLYLRYAVGQNIYPYHMSTSDDVTWYRFIHVDDALKVLRKAVGQDVNLNC